MKEILDVYQRARDTWQTERQLGYLRLAESHAASFRMDDVSLASRLTLSYYELLNFSKAAILEFFSPEHLDGIHHGATCGESFNQRTSMEDDFLFLKSKGVIPTLFKIVYGRQLSGFEQKRKRLLLLDLCRGNIDAGYGPEVDLLIEQQHADPKPQFPSIVSVYTLAYYLSNAGRYHPSAMTQVEGLLGESSPTEARRTVQQAIAFCISDGNAWFRETLLAEVEK